VCAENENNDGLPDDPFWMLTLRWDAEGGLVLDDGGCSIYEVYGLLTAALDETQTRWPGVRFASDEPVEDE
jgi:hypothetical protein